MVDIPKEIAHYFEKKDVKIEVSKFEQYMLNDIYQSNEDSKIKLNRDVTKDFLNEIDLYIKQKRNIRYSMKGETRDGKSLTAMKILSVILKKLGKDFNSYVDQMVCGNQIEYRKKLKDAEFGDVFLIDENFFNQSGLGSNIEAMQLKDYNAQIAKKNISAIFINPERFLNVGATLGLATYGRDSQNWLSRILIYKFKDSFPYLIGYAIIDVGALFIENGCYIFKFTGGCTNTKKIDISKIPKMVVEYTKCIPKNPKSEDLVSGGQTCPFYNICTHGLCKYEHKKDSWIEGEMKGTLDERTKERFKLSIELMLDLGCTYNEESNSLLVRAKSAKDLKNRVKLRVHEFTNTKFSITEFEELIEIIKTNTDLDMFVSTLATIGDDDLIKRSFEIDGGDIIKKMYKQTKKNINK